MRHAMLSNLVCIIAIIVFYVASSSPSKAPTRHVPIDTSTMYSDNVEASLAACEEAALAVAEDGPSYIFSVDSCVLRLKVSI
jgi:hypothetical protein